MPSASSSAGVSGVLAFEGRAVTRARTPRAPTSSDGQFGEGPAMRRACHSTVEASTRRQNRVCAFGRVPVVVVAVSRIQGRHFLFLLLGFPFSRHSPFMALCLVRSRDEGPRGRAGGCLHKLAERSKVCTSLRLLSTVTRRALRFPLRGYKGAGSGGKDPFTSGNLCQR